MGTAFPSLRSDDKGNRRYLRAGTGAACGETLMDRSRYHFSLPDPGTVSAPPLRQAVTSTTIAGHAKRSAQNFPHENMMPPNKNLRDLDQRSSAWSSCQTRSGLGSGVSFNEDEAI